MSECDIETALFRKADQGDAMPDMKEIKLALRKRMEELGFEITTHGINEFSFRVVGVRDSSGKFEMHSANARRIEVIVPSFLKDKLMLPHFSHKNGSYYTCKRFPKSLKAIPDCLEWIAMASTEHIFLREMLHPEWGLPPMRPFVPGDYVSNGGYVRCGHARIVKVIGLAAPRDRRVVSDLYDPSLKAMFLVRVEAHDYLTTILLVNEDGWLATEQIKGEHRVFESRNLPPFNKSDGALIDEACKMYIRKHIDEKKP